MVGYTCCTLPHHFCRTPAHFATAPHCLPLHGDSLLPWPHMPGSTVLHCPHTPHTPTTFTWPPHACLPASQPSHTHFFIAPAPLPPPQVLHIALRWHQHHLTTTPHHTRHHHPSHLLLVTATSLHLPYTATSLTTVPHLLTPLWRDVRRGSLLCTGRCFSHTCGRYASAGTVVDGRENACHPVGDSLEGGRGRRAMPSTDGDAAAVRLKENIVCAILLYPQDTYISYISFPNTCTN